MSEPRLSVIVPVYNGRRFLRTAIQSLLAENLSWLEIIVIDDGSTDGGLLSIQDLPVRSIRLPENRGVAVARNIGLKAVTGSHVTFLDADDVLCPGGLRWRLTWLKENTGAQAVAGRPAGIIDENGNLLPAHQHVLHPDYEPPTLLTLDYFQRGGAYPVALWNYLFDVNLVRRVGEFNEEMRLAEDCEYLFKVLRLISIPLVFNPVVFRRVHADNVSIQIEKGKTIVLRPETLRICKKLYADLDLHVSQWNAWENGYSRRHG